MKLSIKSFNDTKFDVEVDEGATVLQLKEAIAASTGTAVEQQRLIFSGRVLKDADLLSSYNIKDTVTVHLVKSNTATRPAAAAAAAAATASANAPTSSGTTVGSAPASTPQTSNPANPFASLFSFPGAMPAAAPGAANPYGAFGGTGMPPMDQQSVLQLLQNPLVQQTMTQMMADPQFVDTMLNQNPALQGMVTPEVRQMFPILNIYVK